MTPFVPGTRRLIMGVVSDRSTACGIARKLRGHGADFAFTHQGEAGRVQ